MNKFTSKESILLYLLAFLNFIIIGSLFVKISGAADGQGLAAGAIVVGYCIFFALAALAASVVFVKFSNHGTVVMTNRVLLIIFVIITVMLTYRFLNLSDKQDSGKESSGRVTVPAGFQIHTIANNFSVSSQNENEIPMGLGFFKPDFFEKSVFYLYSSPNFRKAVSEHPPIDSIVFSQKEPGGFEISYAPPWLKPEHLKLDYEILFFKIQSLTNDFAEITVNDVMQKTMFIDRNAGKIIFWPDFLLQVHSVEFKEPGVQKVRVKPLGYAGEVITLFQFMKPVLVREEWMFVELVNDDYEKVGEGWIQWKENDQLLITYSLLS